MSSTRMLEVPVLRKALIYAFRYTTPLTMTITEAGVDQALRDPLLLDGFHTSLDIMNRFYKASLTYTKEQWNTDVIGNEEIIDFLFHYFEPTIPEGKCSSSSAEPLFELKPPLFSVRLIQQAEIEPMEVDM